MIILTALKLFLLLRCDAIELPPTYTPDFVTLPWKISIENITLSPRRAINALPKTCGVDRAPIKLAGATKIENYPWLGVLYYPIGTTRVTTSVVLVSRQLVIGSALDVYKMPKHDFRTLARVVIGRNCSAPGHLVSDYNYHHEFRRRSYSALVLIQLKLEDHGHNSDLHPICAPPKKFFETHMYALTLSENCKKARVRIYEMDVVLPKECKEFYRNAELDIPTIWPVHSVCAQSKMERNCLWRDGAVLAVKQNGSWHLMGFGINGPGCGAPSRFLDYTMYKRWVKQSVDRTGLPAITRVDTNQIVLRSTRYIQRFGRCDPDEMAAEIFTDTSIINSTTTDPDDPNARGVATYNLTLFTTIDYTCIIIRATHPRTLKTLDKPTIELKSYAPVHHIPYHDNPSQRIHFYVEIRFIKVVVFKISAYGKEIKLLGHKALLKHINQKKRKPNIPWDLKFKKKNQY